jgi:cyclopropane-fatty-acyl-phospholipid synthase
MQNITVGQLRVLSYSHIYTFPALSSQVNNDKPALRAELRIVKDVFWVRLCAMSDLGFAEAYMYGDVECDDLVSLFHASSFISCLLHYSPSSTDIPRKQRKPLESKF